MRTLRPVLAVVGLAAGGLVIALPTASAAPPRCQGVQATIVGTDTRDDLTGTSGRDAIVGLGGWDRIDGLDGNDLICGGEGTDGLRGGQGNDRLYGGPDGRVPDEPPLPVGDTLRGGPGDDRHDGGADGGDDRVSYDTATNGVVVDLGTGQATGQGTDTLVGIEAATGSGGAPTGWSRRQAPGAWSVAAVTMSFAAWRLRTSSTSAATPATPATTASSVRPSTPPAGRVRIT